MTARAFAKLVSRAVSLERALGCIVRLLSRSAARLCAAAPHWEADVQLNILAVREMRFLRESARYFNGQTIIRGASDDALHCFSDASDSGYGAYVIAPSILSAQGQWSHAESSRSSTWRELAAVHRALVVLRGQLAGQELRWHCDNAAAVRILGYGSNKPHLQLLAVQVAESCFRMRIRLFPVWIPRAENSVADELSRCTWEVDCDDWQLQPCWFNYLDAAWGPHTVDRFADATNAHLPIFNSKVFCEGTSGVDAFSFSWAGHNNWLCPPISLVLRTLEKVRADNATAMLIVSWWESSYYWPTLRPTGKSWHCLVTDIRRFPASYNRGRHTSLRSAFSDSPPFWTLALLLVAA